MLSLWLQSAAPPLHTGPSYENLFMMLFGIVQLIVVIWISRINKDRDHQIEHREDDAKERARMKAELDVLRAVVMGGGTSLSGQLERVVNELSALRSDVHTALEELAEQRGRADRIVKP